MRASKKTTDSRAPRHGRGGGWGEARDFTSRARGGQQPAPEGDATLVTLLERAAAHPEVRIGMIDRGERESWLPWAEVRARARAVAGGLQALGVVPGQTVALLFPTGFDFLAAFFGTLLAGARTGTALPAGAPRPARRVPRPHRRDAARRAGAHRPRRRPRAPRDPDPAILAARPPLGCRELDDLPAAPFSDRSRRHPPISASCSSPRVRPSTPSRSRSRTAPWWPRRGC